MTIPEILEELKPYTGKFPMAAMKAAIEQREGITPELLRELEEMAADGKKRAEMKDGMLQTFALYLLAQFREKRAFQPLVKLVSLPGDGPYELFGETVSGGLCRLLGTLYDGDRKALERLVESEDVDECVRWSALDSYIVLERSGQMEREELVEYYRELFRGRLKREYSHVWDGLVCACAELPAPELLPEVRQAYEDGVVDPGVADLPGIERDMLKDPEEIKRKEGDKYSLITDAIAETEWWACFHPEPRLGRAETRKQGSSQTGVLPGRVSSGKLTSSASTIFRSEPKIGRNDPCPCGSGKKYKKCCLGKAES